MNKEISCMTAAAALLALLWSGPGAALSAGGDEPPRISKEELKTLLRDPAVTVIDVRYARNWDKSDRKISGAVREDPNEISSWAGKYGKDRKLVFYCD